MAFQYPAIIEPGDDTTAYGVEVVDLPGCYSAGDTLDEAIEPAREAAAAWIAAALDSGQSIPAPSQPAEVQEPGWILAAIDLHEAVFSDTLGGPRAQIGP